MPKLSLNLLAEAWQDLDGIGDYYLEQAGADSAQRITDGLLDEMDVLAEFPYAGQVHPDPKLAVLGYRKLVLTRTYVAVYKVTDGAVYIYRIVNGRTDYPKLLK